MHFKMSSAICFTLDQSKILLSNNGLTHCKVIDESKSRAFIDNNSNVTGHAKKDLMETLT